VLSKLKSNHNQKCRIHNIWSENHFRLKIIVVFIHLSFVVEIMCMV